MLALWLALLAGPARASEQGDLTACFLSVLPRSAGPGFDLGRYGSPTPVVALRDATKERDGLRFYGDDKVFYHALPAEEMGYASHWYKFELALSDEARVRCEFEALQDPSDPGTMDCSSSRDEQGFDLIVPKKMSGVPETLLWPLKSAVLVRIQSLGGTYSREVRRYRERLESYQKEKEEPPGVGGALRSALGWKNDPPSKPDDSPYVKALLPCQDLEDNEVREAARSAAHMLGVLQP